MTVEDSTLVDDETRRDATIAIRAAYEAAIEIVAPRVLARINALTAAGGGGGDDHLITDAEWSKIAQTHVDDVLGDSLLDGVIAGAAQFARLASPSTLLRAFLKTAEGFAGFVNQLRSNLDAWIVNRIGEGIEGDWGIGQVIEALRKGSPLSRDKADVVIDSDLQAANNAGLFTALQEAEVAAIRWVTMRDERVRPTHRHADRDTIPLGEKFTIDGYSARFPGDPDLPFRLRVNCRCTLAYVDGTQARRVIGSTKSELRAKAASLSISGRAKMTKGQLQHAVLKELCLQGMAGGPDCPDLLDHMNRTALLTVARSEGIVGRYRMSREQLVYELRQSVLGGDIAQTAAGYAPRAEFARSRKLATYKRGRAVASEFTTGSTPSPDARRARRQGVFDEFGGEKTGSVPCIHCGLRLSANPRSGLALLVPEPIIPWSEGGTLALSNLVPSCPSCFRALGGRGLVSDALEEFTHAAG